MSVALKLKNNVLTILIKGEIDHHTAPAIRESIDDAIAVNCNANLVILDFSGVSFMDSSGVGLVMGRYRLLAPMGKMLQVDNLSARDFQILKMSGIGKLTTLNQRYNNVKEKKYDKD